MCVNQRVDMGKQERKKQRREVRIKGPRGMTNEEKHTSISDAGDLARWGAGVVCNRRPRSKQTPLQGRRWGVLVGWQAGSGAVDLSAHRQAVITLRGI